MYHLGCCIPGLFAVTVHIKEVPVLLKLIVATLLTTGLNPPLVVQPSCLFWWKLLGNVNFSLQDYDKFYKRINTF